jgi:hypothetical protein
MGPKQMRTQLRIIQEQLESLKYEAHHGGLDNASYEFYPLLDIEIQNLYNNVLRLFGILDDAEKNSTRHSKKRRKRR